MKKILAVIIIIGLVLIIKNILFSIHSLLENGKTITTLKEEVAAGKKKKQFLAERLYYVNSNEFIEQEARDKLGLIKSGEYVVIAPNEPTPTPPPSKKTTVSRFYEWLRLFL